MNLTNELQRLTELHERGALSDVEFARAKLAVLAGDSPAEIMAGSMSSSVATQPVDIQNELAKLDLEWEHERAKYPIGKHYTGQKVYNPAGSLMALVFFGVIGILVLLAFAGREGPWLTLFGVIGFTVLIGSQLFDIKKAREFQEAERRYRQLRTSLLEGHVDKAADDDEWI